MRGKLGVHVQRHGRARIIPAHAGQTGGTRTLRRKAADHPRACGANRLISVAAACRAGSSPRMRGKLPASSNTSFIIRIIPAHAGQTRYRVARRRVSTDHPRACGANFSNVGNASTRVGSSPRMRGKRALFQILQGQPRIIPAHAGQTAIPRRAWDSCSDHPRACGANYQVVPDVHVTKRIIPAHAGQTHEY